MPSSPNAACAIHFQSPAEWEAWLEANHATSDGIWLKFARKGTGTASVSHPEALEIALCYGWIDGRKESADPPFWLLRFTPRRPGSKWSMINRRKAEALIAQRRMKPSGLREAEAARKDGRWEKAYLSQREITVPDDLQNELDRDPAARAFFATLDSRNRYAILYRIHDAKKPQTRVRRIEKFVAMLREQKTLY